METILKDKKEFLRKALVSYKKKDGEYRIPEYYFWVLVGHLLKDVTCLEKLTETQLKNWKGRIDLCNLLVIKGICAAK